MTGYRAPVARASLVVILLSAWTFAEPLLTAQTRPQPGASPIVAEALRARAQRGARVRVIVELKLPGRGHVAEGQLRSLSEIAAQRREVLAASGRVLTKLAPSDRRLLHQYQTLPFVALELSAAGLAALDAASSDIAQVVEDVILRPVLAQSVPLIQADQAWAAGYDGTGTTVAVLDTGVEASHPFLSGKVVDEACFSSTSNVSRSTCPNGLDEQTGPGAAAPCSMNECLHGTHVAGIAAGNGGPAGQSFSGVAKGAHVMAVQVFSEIVDSQACGGASSCAGAFSSDIIAGLEYVYQHAASFNVVSANMSLGGSSFTGPCDTQPYKPVIDNLRSIGVATVVAAGNSGSGNSLSSPACISTAISVGSTDKSNQVSSFSDVASFLSLFAPGSSITSSVPGGTYRSLSGTSMATPHVAGTWAVLRQAAPGAGVSLILNALRQTGVPITDNRPAGQGYTIPRISVFEALESIVPVTHPAPTLTSVSPSRVRAGISPVTLTLTGTGFDAFTVANWNGQPKPTSVVSTTQLIAQISLADLAAGPSALVSVFAPAPGGGLSTSLPVIVDPPPTLAVSATAVAPGARVTTTLANGFGGSGDWIALAQSGSSNGSYITFTYVGTGVTDRTWTVTMPSTPGSYEFRLFANNGATRAATSPTVVVDASLNPVPSVESLSPSTIPAGGPGLTLTVNGSSFVASSVVQWNGSPRPTTYVSATQVRATIAAADVAAVSTASVRVVTPAPGGGTSSPATFSVTTPPSLTVSATSVSPGSNVTVTLANGSGGATAWLSFALTTAANTSYSAYTYVGGGVTTRTWTVTAPTTPGNYEFRYFPNGDFTRTAASPTVSVQGGQPTPAPVLTSLSPSSVAPGSAAFTLTVNGANFAAASVVRWNGADRATTFVNAGQLRASIDAADVAVAGTAAVTVFTAGGGSSSPLTFTIGQGAGGPPALAVSATSVNTGASVTVTLTNGPGGSGDWLAFAATTAGNASYAQFTYVGPGVTTRTWTVTVPSTPGSYEFRLFLNNGYTRAATSPTITVSTGPSPVPSIASLSPARVVVGSAAFTLAVNGAGFAPASQIRWNGVARSTAFVSSTQLTTPVSASEIATAASVDVSVFTPAPGGGTSTSLPFVISPSPTLTVSATTVLPGSTVTVTLTNGLGGSTDWIAFASTTAPNSAYTAFAYVGAGVTTRTWTVTVPTTGTYEFRLFLNNGYTRVATSVAIESR